MKHRCFRIVVISSQWKLDIIITEGRFIKLYKRGLIPNLVSDCFV